MPDAKQCFVVMPIRLPGSPEHGHFLAIYNEIIKRTMEELQFECTRADEVSNSGSINNDIIQRIAECDILVADLTDLNPNVFYEIGIRHTLRSLGTILLIDETRTERIPFDLSNYRTIKYTGSITGVGSLRESLRGFVAAIVSRKSDFRDSPVHDALPILPPNLFEQSRNSTEGRMRVELEEAKLELAQLKKRFSAELQEAALSVPNPRDKLEYFLAQALRNNLPQQILNDCNKAAKEYNFREFIEHATQLCAAEYGHEARIFINVAGLASQLGLDYIGVAIYDYAVSIFPWDPSLQENRISFLLTSGEAEVRERARRELQLKWEVSIDQQGVYAFGKPLKSADVFLATRYYDSLKSDNMISDSFQYAKGLIKVSVDPRILRTMGAALIDQDKHAEAYTYYKSSALLGTPNSTPVTLRFWATDLVNNGKLLEAVQIQARGCLSDLDDSMSFGWLVESCNRFRKHANNRYPETGEHLEEADVIAIVNCALSCSSISMTAIRYIADALGFDQSQVADLRTEVFSMEKRCEQVKKIQSIFGDDYFDSVEAANIGGGTASAEADAGV